MPSLSILTLVYIVFNLSSFILPLRVVRRYAFALFLFLCDLCKVVLSRQFISLVALYLLWGISTAQKSYTLTVRVDSIPSENLPKKERIKHESRFSSINERHKAVSDILFSFYENGYLYAEADSIGGDSLALSINVKRGSKLRYAQIGKGNLDERMIPNAIFRDKMLYREPFSPKRTAALFRGILAQYENNGFPFAAVKADSVSIDSGTVRMAIRVEKGPAVMIDSIIIRGSANVKPSFLHGYLGIRKKSLYNEKSIKNITRRLKDLPFISVGRPYDIRFTSPENAHIVLYAQKVNASRFNGLIGFMPGGTNTSKLLVTGEVDLGLWNALGYGEQLTLKWRRIQAGTQSLNFFVKYPYLFGTPLAVNGAFDFYRRDSTFQNIDLGIGVQYLFSGTSFVEVFYRRQIAQVIDIEKFIAGAQLPESIDFTANNAGIKVNVEQYDYRWNPTRGFLVNFTVWGGAKNMRKRSDIPQQVYDGIQLRSFQAGGELKADYFIRFHKRVTLKPGIQLAHSVNPYRFLNELYRIGGINSLRGFNEDAFFLSSYAFGNMELRYLIEQNSNIFLFFNGGWGERKITTGYFRDTPYGFGAGLNFFTKVGYINFAYGLGSSQGQPIEFRNGKIHLGFTGVF